MKSSPTPSRKGNLLRATGQAKTSKVEREPLPRPFQQGPDADRPSRLGINGQAGFSLRAPLVVTENLGHDETKSGK